MMSMAHSLDDFERFDVEYSDSDQTISRTKSRLLSSKLRELDPRSFGSQNTSTSNRGTAANFNEQKSSFFPDSSEEDNFNKHDHNALYSNSATVPVSNRSSMTFCASGGRMRNSTAIQGERLHFGEIQFPNVKSVLWDRRVLAGPFTIVFEKLLPNFAIRSDILSRLLMDSGKNCGTGGPVGWLQAEKMHQTREISKVQLLAADSEVCHAEWKIPVYCIEENAGSLQATEAIYQERLQSAQKRYQTDGNEISVDALEAHVLIRRNGKQNATVGLQIFLPRVSLTFTMIKSLPLLRTPIVSALMSGCGAKFGSEGCHNGYVTLDQFRKAVPLIKMDPLVAKRPIVGVWIAGLVDLESNWEEISARLAVSKVLYDTCVSFLFSSLISERVTPTTNSFLVVLFPPASTSKVASGLPRFLECKYGEDYIEVIHSAAIKEITTLLSDAQVCAIGIKNLAESLVFRPRVEVNTDTNWTGARASSKPVVLAPLQPNGIESKCIQVASPQPSKSILLGKPSRSISITTTDRNSLSLTSVTSGRYCCRMQKRLTLQHQEILENQQKQLHWLQDQIRQLQEIVHPPQIKEDHNAASDSEPSSLNLSSASLNSEISSTNSFLDHRDSEARDPDNAQVPTLSVPTASLVDTVPADSQDAICEILPKMNAESLSSPTHVDIPSKRLVFPTKMDTGAVNNHSISIPKIRSICFIDSDSDDQEMRDIERRYARMHT